MDDLRTLWFCLQLLVHLQKGQCESEPHQTKTKKVVTLYNKVLLVNIVNNICKHELRINNTSTAFINLS